MKVKWVCHVKLAGTAERDSLVLLMPYLKPFREQWRIRCEFYRDVDQSSNVWTRR